MPASKPLPPDRHVHSEWSWDAPDGSMERTCALGVELGLPALAFTEHVDHLSWRVLASDVDEHEQAFVSADGVMTPPELDLAGYSESLQRCRALFPNLNILSGVELGEPHWNQDATRQLLADGQFDVVLGSLHGLMVDGEFSEMPNLFRTTPAPAVLRAYLLELENLIGSTDTFQVLAHLDYPIRYWPTTAGRFDPGSFEAEFRHVLRLLADSGRALELNTQIPIQQEFLSWWAESGGQLLSFGSDAHEPDGLAHDFADAAELAEAHGFRPGRYPHEFWKLTAP
jgi:histidinol-phosphatase (PHP family)